MHQSYDAVRPRPGPGGGNQNILTITAVKPMCESKRAVLAVLKLMVVLGTVVATSVALAQPGGPGVVLAEVARAVAAGVLFSGVKVLTRLGRPVMVTRPVRCWWGYGRAVVWHDVRCAMVAGYLLGLVLAVWLYCVG